MLLSWYVIYEIISIIHHYMTHLNGVKFVNSRAAELFA